MAVKSLYEETVAYEDMYAAFIAGVYQSLYDHRDSVDKYDLSADLDKVCGPDLISDINKYCDVADDFTAEDAFDSLTRRYASVYHEDPDKISQYAKRRGFYTFAKVLSDELNSNEVFDFDSEVSPVVSEIHKLLDVFKKDGKFRKTSDLEAFNSLLYEQVKDFKLQYDSDDAFASAREEAAANLRKHLSAFGYESSVSMAELPDEVRDGYGDLNPHELTVLAADMRQQMSMDRQGMYASVFYYESIGIKIDDDTIKLLGYDYETYRAVEQRNHKPAEQEKIDDMSYQDFFDSLDVPAVSSGDKPLMDFSKSINPQQQKRREYESGISQETEMDDKEYS